MSIVGSDLSIFKKLISALQSPENERFHSAFIQGTRLLRVLHREPF